MHCIEASNEPSKTLHGGWEPGMMASILSGKTNERWVTSRDTWKG